MDKTQALQRLTALENEAAELRKIIEAPKQKSKKTPEQWLTDFLNENSGEFTVKLGQDSIIYYLGEQWIFDLDLKSKMFWCYYYRVWEVFYKEHDMKYEQVQELMRNVVLKAFNCEGFTPSLTYFYKEFWVLKAFNCEGFTPQRAG